MVDFIRTTIRIKLSKEARKQYDIATNKSEFVRKCIESACVCADVKVDSDKDNLEFYMQEMHRKIDELKYKLDNIVISVDNDSLKTSSDEVEKPDGDLGEHAITLQAFMNFGSEEGDE